MDNLNGNQQKNRLVNWGSILMQWILLSSENEWNSNVSIFLKQNRAKRSSEKDYTVIPFTLNVKTCKTIPYC